MGLVTVNGKLVLVEGKPIDVPSSVETQEKTVTITENGTVEVVPDTGKALSKVTVNVAVPSALADEWKAATNWATYASYIVGA